MIYNPETLGLNPLIKVVEKLHNSSIKQTLPLVPE